MSLLHNPMILPPPRDRIAELTRENEAIKAEIRELKIDLLRERESNSALEQGVINLRNALTPLHRALGQVFGEIEATGIQDSQGTPVAQPKHKAVWDSWKEKLGGKAADAIDALLLHGEMTHTQLKIHIRCGQQTVYDTVHRLNKAGIINKNGSRISLKGL